MDDDDDDVIIALCVSQRLRNRRRQRFVQQMILARRRRLARMNRHPGRLGSQLGRIWIRDRMHGQESRSLLMYLLHENTSTFVENFRVDIPMYNFLLDGIRDQLAVKPGNFRKDAVQPDEALAMARYHLGSTSEYRSIAHVARRGETTVAKHTMKVCNAIVKKWGQTSADPVIKMASGAELHSLAEHMWHKRGMPNCAGGMDGKHWLVRVGNEPHAHSTSHNWSYCSDLQRILFHRRRREGRDELLQGRSFDHRPRIGRYSAPISLGR